MRDKYKHCGIRTGELKKAKPYALKDISAECGRVGHKESRAYINREYLIISYWPLLDNPPQLLITVK